MQSNLEELSIAIDELTETSNKEFVIKEDRFAYNERVNDAVKG